MYELIKHDGSEWKSLGRTRDFTNPPTLSANKGKWVERIIEPADAYDPRIQTLTENITISEDSVVISYTATDKSNQVINQYVRSELSDRTALEMAGDFTIGNVTTNRAELETLRDELDGSEVSEINLRSDSYTLSIAQQSSIRGNIRARYRATNKRSYDIAELLKAANPGAARVVVLDAEIDTGWPSGA